MKYSVRKYWIISLLALGFLLFLPNQEVKAQTYTDSIAFKIDSAKIENSNLVYSVMFWRTNENWRGTSSSIQDTVLGNVDLYFWMKDVIFAKNQNPVILRKHAAVGGANDLLNISVGYHAERFRIQLTSKTILSPTMKLVGVPYNKPIELCKVQMALQYNDRNPEFVWDDTATGGQSNIGEPLIMDLQGDVFQNPIKSIVLEDYSKIDYVCQGGVAKIWARGHSTGTKLNTSWVMSKKVDFSESVALPSDITGPFVGTNQMHYSNTVSTKWGDLFYMVSATNTSTGSRSDTLILPNVPGWIDSMYFQCVLSDASLGVASRKSTEGDTRIFLRDSIFGWFAASDPNNRGDGPGGIGASDRTDTIFKCPSLGAQVSFFFFGPKCDEDVNTIGRSMTVSYMGRDQAANPFLNPLSVKLTSWSRETSQNAPNGRCLYRGTVVLPDSLTNVNIWVSSISTEKGCGNGASYAAYDTVYITDLAGDKQALVALTDTTLSSGESMALSSKYPYTNYYLKTPALGSLNLGTSPKTYKAPSASCTNPNGCRDTIVYEYTSPIMAGCTMTAQQVVNLADWFYLSPKIILEGAYRPGLGKMKEAFFGMTPPLLPHTSPYKDNLFVANFPAGKAIVDWIFISIRKTPGAGETIESAVDQVVAEESVFLLDDGSICNSKGEPYVKFNKLHPNAKYYVVIDHRNHVTVRSKCSYAISKIESSPTFIDFTQLANLTGTVADYVALGAGVYALSAGDINKDNVISGSDKNELLQAGSPTGYVVFDVDFDTVVSGTDRSVLLKNNGAGSDLYNKLCP